MTAVVAAPLSARAPGTDNLAEKEDESGEGRFGLAPNAPGLRPNPAAPEGIAEADGGPYGSRMGDEPVALGEVDRGADWMEDDNAERMGTGAAGISSTVGVAGTGEEGVFSPPLDSA